MNTPVPAPALSDYQMEVSTLQSLSLDPRELDMTDYVKTVSVRILKPLYPLTETEVVGEAEGVVVLSSLAGNEGVELRDVLDEHDGDLADMYDELLEAGIELPSWEDLVVLSDVTIPAAHRVPGVEMALFQQLIRTAGAEMNVAVTYDACLGLDRKAGTNGSRKVTLPEGMRRVPRAGLVVWTGDRIAS